MMQKCYPSEASCTQLRGDQPEIKTKNDRTPLIESFAKGSHRRMRKVADLFRPKASSHKRSEHLTHIPATTAIDELGHLREHLHNMHHSLRNYGSRLRKFAVAAAKLEISTLALFSSHTNEAISRLSQGRQLISSELSVLGERIERLESEIKERVADLDVQGNEAKLINTRADHLAGMRRKDAATASTEEEAFIAQCDAFVVRHRAMVAKYETVVADVALLFLEINAERFAALGSSLTNVRHRSKCTSWALVVLVTRLHSSCRGRGRPARCGHSAR